jgi:hypothetical protein
MFYVYYISGGESKSVHHGKNEFKILKPQMAIVWRERERVIQSSRLFAFWHLCLDNEYNKNNNNNA